MGAVRKPVLSKVWNDNKYPHTEKYKGQIVTIMPGQYIEMSPDDAEMLKGQFTPIKMFKGAPDPKFFKMIRIEHPDNWGCEEKFTCPVTGKNFETADELNESLKRFPHLRHRDRDEDSIAAGKDEKIALLEQTIAEMRSEMRTFMAAHAIRGRGRPRKSEAENDLDEGTENGESDS